MARRSSWSTNQTTIANAASCQSECNNVQFDWFATGVFESFRTSGMRGKITRLLACNEDELQRYKGMDLGPTFVHPNYRHNQLNGDTSASYNKPGSVMHWSTSANFTERSFGTENG